MQKSAKFKRTYEGCKRRFTSYNIIKEPLILEYDDVAVNHTQGPGVAPMLCLLLLPAAMPPGVHCC